MSLAADAIHYGFVTSVEIEGMGWCGGMLLLNSVARPLEFHCTLPVKPNRSQEILYGKSLKPFLCGQVIAKALLDKAKTKPHLVITDCRDTAHLSQCDTTPVAFHPDQEGIPDLMASWNLLETGEQAIHWHSPPALAKDVPKWLDAYGSRSDFAEPFERIRQAIQEAHQVARKSA